MHRDLKPSNLMIVRNDSGDSDALVVKVIDFGLAKSVAMTPAEDNQTRVGFSGTPDFASPEQLRAGEHRSTRARTFFTRSDALVFALWPAALSWQLGGKSSRRWLPLEQLTLAHVPEPVIALLRSMLAVEPGGRPASARELLTELQRCRQVIANPSFSFT